MKRGSSTEQLDLKPSAPAWTRLPVLLAMALLFFLLTVLAITQSASALVDVIEGVLTDGTLALLWLTSAAGLGRLAMSALRDRRIASVAFGFVSSVAIGIGCIGFVVLLLGLVGVVNRGASIIALAPGWIAAAMRVVRSRAMLASIRSVRINPWSWLWLLAVPALAIACSSALLPAGIFWGDEPNGYDVTEYHLQVPREWHDTGRIVGLEHNVFSYFPFGVEMQFLLAMELYGDPWRAMFLAQLMHVAMGALVAAAVFGTAREWGQAAPSATLAGVLMGVAPWLLLLSPVAYVENGLLLFGTLTIGWCVRAMRDDESPMRSALLGGVFAGLACGVKLTAVPMLVLCVPIAVMLARGRGAFINARLLKCCAIYIATATLIFSPWLVRTAIWTRGNPVFPEATAVFGKAHWDDVQVERWRRANHQPDDAHRSGVGRLRALWEQVIGDPRYGYFLLPLALIAIVINRRLADVRMLGVLLALMCVFWLCLTHVQGRFLTLAIPVCALLIGSVDARVWRAGVSLLAGVVAVVGVVVCVQKLDALDQRFIRLTQGSGLWATIGVHAIDRTAQPALDALPADATLVLVGDAQAYLYHRQTALLRYRTIFDVSGVNSTDAIRAWREDFPSAREVLLIDPAELHRFAKSYWMAPRLPMDLAERNEPFVLH